MDNYRQRTNIKSDDKITLLEELVNCKMNAQEFANNQKVVEKIGEFVDKFSEKKRGYALLTITSQNKTELKLIAKKRHQYYGGKERIYIDLHSWTIPQAIEQVIGVEIHKQSQEDILSKIDNLCGKSSLSWEEILSAVITETMTGYEINTAKIEALQKFIETNHFSEVVPNRDIGIQDSLLLDFKKEIESEKRSARKRILEFVKRLNCSDLKLRIGTDGITGKDLCVARIDEVKNIANNRYFKYTSLNDGKNTSKTSKVCRRSAETTSNALNVRKLGKIFIVEAEPRNDTNHEIMNSLLSRLPYNFVDKGRYFILVKRHSGKYNLIISGDPRVDENHVDTLRETFTQYTKLTVARSVSMDQTTIENHGKKYYFQSYENDVAQEKIVSGPLQIKMKALKRMVDEYNYLIKKEKVEGKDVLITDKIGYNSAEGKISYNDFSIGIDDEFIKSKLQGMFDGYLVQFYRNETTEQEILDRVLNEVFRLLQKRLDSTYKEEFSINIAINQDVQVNISCKLTKSNARIFYLNGQRYNKNEIITVLREITCYRDQAQADTFLKTIGKVGLSVYIGMTTGYEIKFRTKRPKAGEEDTDDNFQKRIFRFKKDKGRSNYRIVLDTLDIPIKGKGLISLLYSHFIGDDVIDLKGKIKQTVAKSCQSSTDYLKYRFLIDSAYDSFKKKSRELLEKKVKETESEEIIYHNSKNNKKMDAIYINGTSGRKYVLAYDQKNSYVFIDPIKDEENSKDKKVYKEGKYICMIDQSNIKSNIGYDTVIAKLMALRNDSVIASTIYNLEDELD